MWTSMKFSQKSAAVIAALLVASPLPALNPTPARAASPQADALEAAGFFGTWSLRCDRAPGPTNIMRQAYISAAGEAGFSENLGPDVAENIYRILDVAVTGSTVVLDVELNGTVQQRLTMRIEGKRIRTIENELADGRLLVKDGMITTVSIPTPWLNRCDLK